MIGFIIIGHGEFATGIYSACKLVDKTYSNVKKAYNINIRINKTGGD